jgi:hypothetical protein
VVRWSRSSSHRSNRRNPGEELSHSGRAAQPFTDSHVGLQQFRADDDCVSLAPFALGASAPCVSAAVPVLATSRNRRHRGQSGFGLPPVVSARAAPSQTPGTVVVFLPARLQPDLADHLDMTESSICADEMARVDDRAPQIGEP